MARQKKTAFPSRSLEALNSNNHARLRISSPNGQAGNRRHLDDGNLVGVPLGFARAGLQSASQPRSRRLRDSLRADSVSDSDYRRTLRLRGDRGESRAGASAIHADELTAALGNAVNWRIIPKFEHDAGVQSKRARGVKPDRSGEPEAGPAANDFGERFVPKRLSRHTITHIAGQDLALASVASTINVQCGNASGPPSLNPEGRHLKKCRSSFARAGRRLVCVVWRVR